MLLGVPAAPEIGSPAVTRLWQASADGAAPVCTAVYVRERAARAGPGRVWLLTARHCTGPGPAHVGRSGPERPFIQRPDGGEPPAGVDVAVGSAPAPHPALDLAERMPRRGTVVIHGFPFGIEHLTAARVVGESAARPGSIELHVVTGPQTEAGPGLSGAPVLDAHGQVVGMLWGLRAEGDRTLRAFVTPVETIREILHRAAR